MVTASLIQFNFEALSYTTVFYSAMRIVGLTQKETEVRLAELPGEECWRFEKRPEDGPKKKAGNSSYFLPFPIL